MEVAVKEMALKTKKDLDHFNAEVAIMQRLNHPHVVQFMGAATPASTTARKGFLILELMQMSLLQALDTEMNSILKTEIGQRRCLRHIVEG